MFLISEKALLFCRYPSFVRLQYCTNIIKIYHWQNDSDSGKPKYWKKNLLKCYSIYRKSHMDYPRIKPAPPRYNASLRNAVYLNKVYKFSPTSPKSLCVSIVDRSVKANCGYNRYFLCQNLVKHATIVCVFMCRVLASVQIVAYSHSIATNVKRSFIKFLRDVYLSWFND